MPVGEQIVLLLVDEVEVEDVNVVIAVVKTCVSAASVSTTIVADVKESVKKIEGEDGFDEEFGDSDAIGEDVKFSFDVIPETILLSVLDDTVV